MLHKPMKCASSLNHHSPLIIHVWLLSPPMDGPISSTLHIIGAANAKTHSAPFDRIGSRIKARMLELSWWMEYLLRIGPRRGNISIITIALWISSCRLDLMRLRMGIWSSGILIWRLITLEYSTPISWNPNARTCAVEVVHITERPTC